MSLSSADVSPQNVVPVGIVGGGFSGTVLAALLARRGVASVVIEGSGRMGRGTAFSTAEEAHLLNVPAKAMSAFADDLDHFAEHFAASGGDPSDFAERRFYGRYLGDILDNALASGLVKTLDSNASAAKRSGNCWSVTLADGRVLTVSALVLAMGNQSPEPMAAMADAGPLYIADPWGAEARSAIARSARSPGEILLIGTGLTMVDTVLSLEAAGFGARIVALSRRGQAPRSHGPNAPAVVEYQDLPSGDLIGLARWLRRRSAEVGWRSAIDSLRPHSQTLWSSLSVEQQKRFLRHARPFWDVHRHRIAPRVAKRIADLVGEGRLQILAARIVDARESGTGVDVDFRRRGSAKVTTQTFQLIVNCTGPLHSISRTSDPLLRGLLDSGDAEPDSLGIGLRLGEGHRVKGAARLWAMGALTKGHHWEIVAVPDIRLQAAEIAADIVKELANG